ncbi:MAG: ABC transporter permease [Bacteroidales bacterium]|nr:ABC transporter permease [Bacteroidales bacterium]
MKTLLKISWRNIWRNPKRSMVMIIAITLGLWAGVSVSALMFGLLDQRFKTSIEQHVSHLQIHNPEFLKDNNVKYGIAESESLMAAVSSDPEIKTFSGRTIVNGMLATATLTRGINIIGIDPLAEANTTGLDRNIFEGTYFVESGRNPVLIGKKLAEKTKLQIRSRLVLTFQNKDGELVSASFRVAGIFQSANTMLDERNIYVLQTDIIGYIGHDETINELAIVAHDLETVNGLSESYSQRFPGLSVRTWAEISPELSYMQEMSESMLMIILAIILFALAFGLVNTMLMSVFERVHELGMLMAVGMNRKKVFGMIMFETSFLTFLGAMGGMLFGFLTTQFFGRTGINLAKVGGDSLHSFGFPSKIYPSLNADFFLMLTMLVIITAFLTSIYPAMKALRLKPAEAIRKE